MSRVTDRQVGSLEWFDMWKDDKKSIIAMMTRNMLSDIENGYSPVGYCIRRQVNSIHAYENEYHEALDKFATMDEKAVDRYCYYDMLKRGVID